MFQILRTLIHDWDLRLCNKHPFFLLKEFPYVVLISFLQLENIHLIYHTNAFILTPFSSTTRYNTLSPQKYSLFIKMRCFRMVNMIYHRVDIMICTLYEYMIIYSYREAN